MTLEKSRNFFSFVATLCLTDYDDIHRKSVYANVLKVSGTCVSNFSVKIRFYHVYGFHDIYKVYIQWLSSCFD